MPKPQWKEVLHMYNGNNQPVQKELPKIILIVRNDIDHVVINHIKKNTDLYFERNRMGYEVHPVSSNQIVRLLLTYNLKTAYHNNNDSQNTLYVTFHDILNQPVFDMLKKT